MTTEGWGRRGTGADGQEGWESESGCLLRGWARALVQEPIWEGDDKSCLELRDSKCVWSPPQIGTGALEVGWVCVGEKVPLRTRGMVSDLGYTCSSCGTKGRGW